MTLVLRFGVAATVVSASFWTYAAARIGLVARVMGGSKNTVKAVIRADGQAIYRRVR